MSENLEDLISSGEASALLGISDFTVRKQADAGQLPVAATVGRHKERLFRKGDIINIAIARAVKLDGPIDFTRPGDILRLADAISKCTTANLKSVLPVVQAVLPEVPDSVRVQLGEAVIKAINRSGPTSTRTFGRGETVRKA
jgi:hypothetical protein